MNSKKIASRGFSVVSLFILVSMAALLWAGWEYAQGTIEQSRVENAALNILYEKKIEESDKSIKEAILKNIRDNAFLELNPANLELYRTNNRQNVIADIHFSHFASVPFSPTTGFEMKFPLVLRATLKGKPYLVEVP